MIQDNSGSIGFFLLLCIVGVVIFVLADREMRRFLCWGLIFCTILLVAIWVSSPNSIFQGINP